MKFYMTVARRSESDAKPTVAIYDRESGHTSYIDYQPELDDLEKEGQKVYTFAPNGIVKKDDDLLVVSNSKLGRFSLETHEFLGLIDMPLMIHTHQICIHNDWIISANSANDTLTIYLPDGTNFFFSLQFMSVVDRVSVPNNATQLNWKHVNSVESIDENHIAVMANNDTTYGSAMYIIDTDKMVVVQRVPSGNGNYGIAIEDIGISYTSCAITGDIMKMKYGVPSFYNLVDPNMYFLRGARIHDEKVYVVAGAKEGAYTDALLFEFDPEKERITDSIELCGIKEVNDFIIN